MNKLTLSIILFCTFVAIGAQPVKAAPGDIVNLNFGINNSYPWFQTFCGDIRIDNGIVNKVPLGFVTINTNASCATPGIGFTGDTSPDFADGTISTTGQIVGGSTYPELYTSNGSGTIFSSYSYLNQKALSSSAVVTDLATVCTLNNCTLPVGLPKGIYRATGNVTLNDTNFPLNQNYIFLINGDLTINGDIITPPSSTSFFSVSGNIIILPTIGTIPGLSGTNLAGIFSTDKSFILQSTNNCTDLQLNVEGTLIVNAGKTSSILQNDRSLCNNNSQYPTLTIKQRLDYVLNLPDFLKIQKVTSQEINP